MPTESLYPKIAIPDVDVWGLIFEQKDRPFPDDKEVFVDAETHQGYTFAQVKEVATQWGKGLKSAWDWRKGDVMALYTPNHIDTPPFVWGVHWAGGICSPANPGYTVEELVYQLKDSGAKALVTQLSLIDNAVKAAKIAGIPEDRIILLGDTKDPSHRFKHFTSVQNITGTNRYRRTKANPSKDLAFLVYSSGTTGNPKGVMLTHRNIVSNVLQGQAAEASNLTWNGGPDGKGDKIVAFLPFFHIYGLVCLIHVSMSIGTTLIVMAKFDIERFCAIVQERKATFAYIVPPVVLLLGKHPAGDKYDLSSLRMMNSGAAPLTKELVNTVYNRLKVPLKQGYGLSETSPTTHTQPWELWDKPIGSVGRMMPNMTAKFMSAEEKELPVGQVGELWIKGPNVFAGYHNNLEATRNALTPDGYFKTGDIGYQDPEGNFFITDRVKELIKYKGFQVPPAELEGLLLDHPKVNDVAVIGVYEEDLASEVPRAYVVVKPSVEPSKETAREIISWLQSRVANHKRLRGGVRFVDAIPKSASGKILRRVLKTRVQEEQKGRFKARL